MAQLRGEAMLGVKVKLLRQLSGPDAIGAKIDEHLILL
jgi:hypothetical protein